MAQHEPQDQASVRRPLLARPSGDEAPQLSPGAWTRRAVAIGLAAAIAVLCGRVSELLVYGQVGADASWYLYVAGLVLDGAQLYGPRVTETNPPLIVWASTIPVVLSRWGHLTPLLALKVSLAVATFSSAAWTLRILRAAGLATTPVLGVLWGAIAIGVELYVTPGQAVYQLAQREQWLVILSLPYVVSALSGAEARLSMAERTSIGVAAAVATCLKPHQVIIFVGLEVFLAAWTRSVRRVASPTFLSWALVVCCYPLVVRLAAPAYLSETVPLLVDTYWAYGGKTAAGLMFGDMRYTALLALTWLVWLLCRRRLHLAVAPPALLVCSLTASLAYGLQHTGWSYHAIPRTAFLLLALVWMFFDLVSGLVARLERAKSFTALFAIATAIQCAVTLAMVSGGYARPEEPPDGQVDGLLGEFPGRAPVYMLSTDLDGFEAVFKRQLVWGGRFACLWLLPAIVQNEAAATGGPPSGKPLAPSTLARLASLQRASTAEDLRHWRPGLVLVERCGHTGTCQAITDRHFDLLPWFLKDPAFASEWAHYCRETRSDRYDAYLRLSASATCIDSFEDAPTSRDGG